MAMKLEEEKVEETRIKDEHKAARKAIKAEIQYRTPRAVITQAGTFHAFQPP